MKIWFDISNSPHINMFFDLIKELENEGHSVIITSRPLANTVALLNQRRLKHTIIGKHYGKSFFKKIFGYPIRVLQLRKFLKTIKPDVAISQSSFHSPVVARLLGIPSIFMNDNEHAMGNIPAFLCATKILIPEFLNIKKIQRQCLNRNKIILYPGVKEGIYLWQRYLPNISLVQPAVIQRKHIYIRPEPRTAQYYKGEINFLDDLIINLKEIFNLIILTRDEEQLNYYQTEIFSGVHVPDIPIMFTEIVNDCLLFIGAGGTMTREMAVIGVPTISVYQDDLLEVDKYLIDQELMLHILNLTSDIVKKYIAKNESRPPNTNLLVKGRKSYTLIKSLIGEIGQKNRSKGL